MCIRDRAITMQANAQLVFTGFDLNPGAGDSSPWQFVNYNGKMLFNAATTASGAELWISDGTSAGTQPVSYTHLDVYKRQIPE